MPIHNIDELSKARDCFNQLATSARMISPHNEHRPFYQTYKRRKRIIVKDLSVRTHLVTSYPSVAVICQMFLKIFINCV